MQVFKAFFLTVKTQIGSISIYFIIFLILTVIMSGNMKKESEVVFQDTKLKMAVIDRDNTELSKSLYNYLHETQIIVDIADDQEVISDELFYRNVEYVLFINEGFETNMMEGNYERVIDNVKVPQSTTGAFLDNKIEEYLKILSTYLLSGYSATEAINHAKAATLITTDVTLHETSGPTEDKSSLYYFYTYIAYVLIGMLTMGLGEILITFRKRDLSARIRCSAMTEARRNGELILSSLLFSLACLSSYIILSFILHGEEMLGIKGALFILNSLVYLLFTISFTYLLSFLVHTINGLNMASNIIGLGLSFLGGVFVPLQFLSPSVLRFSKFLPTYWYVRTSEVIDDFHHTSEQIETILCYMSIELLFAFALFIISVRLSKSNKIAKYS